MAAVDVGVVKGGGRFRLPRRLPEQRLLVLIGALAGATVGFSVAVSGFGSLDSLRSVGYENAPLIIASIGLTLVVLTGELDLSIGAVVPLTAVLVGKLFESSSLDAAVVILVALATGVAIGVVNAVLTLVVGIPSFLATLGMYWAMSGLALWVSLSPLAVNSGTLHDLFLGNLGGFPRAVIYVVAVVAVAGIVKNRTRFGMRARAAGSGGEMARLAAVPIARTKFMVFVACGLCAAFAGVVLAGSTGFADPLSTDTIELPALAAVILGGTRLEGGRASLIGTVVGALLIGVLVSGIEGAGLSSSLQDITRGATIGIAVLLMRQRKLVKR